MEEKILITMEDGQKYIRVNKSTVLEISSLAYKLGMKVDETLELVVHMFNTSLDEILNSLEEEKDLEDILKEMETKVKVAISKLLDNKRIGGS
ncbi:MAG: hypothetical protein QXP36_06395 [Conexivisphaerales archaeon]